MLRWPRFRTIKHYFQPDDGNWLLQRTGLCLLRTCKTVCLEASQVLYGENTLHLAPHDVQQISKFLDCVSAGNCANIRRIVLDFEQCQNDALLKYERSEPERENSLGACWRKQYRDFWTDHEECIQDSEEALENSSNHSSVDSGEEFLLNETPDEPECLFDSDLYEGYPNWGRQHWYLSEEIPSRDIAQINIAKAIQSLTRCTNLRQLRLVFPDPQRHIAGWRCLVDCPLLSEAFRQVVVNDQLDVEGVDDLCTLGHIVDLLNVPQVTATLNNSIARPNLHVEAGRPNLRAYSNWQVIKSTWKTIQFRRIQTEVPARDRFSFLPRELTWQILNYLLEPDEELENDFEAGPFVSGSLAVCHTEAGGYVKVFPKSTSTFSVAIQLIKVSKIFYRQTIVIIYRDSVFAGNYGAMLAFLTKIGESNRLLIRYLCIDWAACSSDITEFMDEEAEDMSRTLADYDNGIEHESWKSSNRRNMQYLSQVFRTLTLLGRSSPLHWLLLTFPKVQTLSDFSVHTFDILHSKRFLETCALVKVKNLWLWDTINLFRGESLGRSMEASMVFMQIPDLAVDEDMRRLYQSWGWEIGTWAVSKRLVTTSGCVNRQIHRMDTSFLLDRLRSHGNY